MNEPIEDDGYEDDEEECPHCHGDGRDPYTDYLMPCPLCQGEPAMSEDLKPCPMCEGPATFVKHSAGLFGTMGFDKWDAVACKGCGATVGACDRRFRNKDDARGAWNRRAGQQGEARPAREEVEAMFRQLEEDCDNSDGACYGTIDTGRVRDFIGTCRAALATQAAPEAQAEPAGEPVAPSFVDWYRANWHQHGGEAGVAQAAWKAGAAAEGDTLRALLREAPAGFSADVWKLASPVDREDFFGVAAAISQALSHDDFSAPDEGMDPKVRRRLSQALTVALGWETSLAAVLREAREAISSAIVNGGLDASMEDSLLARIDAALADGGAK